MAAAGFKFGVRSSLPYLARALQHFGQQLGKSSTLKARRQWTGEAFAKKMNRVNLLNEVLNGLGRWYVAIPPFLIVSFLAALFFVTGQGQQRLQEAGERLQKSAAREQGIEALQSSLSRSVGAQSGFLLTGDQRYIDTYNRAVAEVEPRLEELRLAYAGSDAGLSQVRDLHVLIGKRLAEFCR